MSDETLSLLVRTNSYTGNTDTFILGALFGINDGRYGGKIGVNLWSEHFNEDDEDFFDVVTCGNTEYGPKEYQINNDFHDSYNTLEIFIDEYAEEHLRKMFPRWTEAYGNGDGTLTLAYVEEDETYPKNYNVKITGFALKHSYLTYNIEEIEN